MTIARKQLIDVSVTRWYHCMPRFVRHVVALRRDLGPKAVARESHRGTGLAAAAIAGSTGSRSSKTADGLATSLRPKDSRQPPADPFTRGPLAPRKSRASANFGLVSLG